MRYLKRSRVVSITHYHQGGLNNKYIYDWYELLSQNDYRVCQKTASIIILTMACELRDKAIAQFTKTFNEKPSVYAYAPGRVNFIGEHTDYCEGFVCPLANSTRNGGRWKTRSWHCWLTLTLLWLEMPRHLCQHGQHLGVQRRRFSEA